MNAAIDFAASHKAAIAVAGAWIIREAHNAWPMLKAAWPFCQTNGGAFGIARQFLFGKPNQNQNPK